MRLAVVEPSGRGGMIHYAFQLCRALAHEGIEVTLVTGRTYELDSLEAPFRVEKLFDLWDPKPEEAPPGAATRTGRRLRRVLRAGRYAREHRRLVAFLSAERPDWVQLGDVRFAGDLLWIAALRRHGLRLTDVCHNVRRFAPGGTAAGLFRHSSVGLEVYRRIYRHCERVWVHFDSNRKRFLAEMRLPPEKVGAIPHGNQILFEELRDPEVTPETLRQRLGLQGGEPVVLLFGTLTRYKGVELLLEALPVILAAEPRARLVVAGFPAADFSAEGFRHRVRGAGLETAVRFYPRYVPAGEVAAWMELASVVALPYRQIFQSGALHLAQTFGRPVVATVVGAMPEVVHDRRTGLLVPPGDRDALGGSIGELLTRPGLARDLGRRARSAALGRFAWRRVAAILAADYRRLSGLPGPQSGLSLPC